MKRELEENERKETEENISETQLLALNTSITSSCVVHGDNTTNEFDASSYVLIDPSSSHYTHKHTTSIRYGSLRFYHVHHQNSSRRWCL